MAYTSICITILVLVGGLEHEFYLSIQLGIITPTDELIFFRGVAQPPTSNIIVSIGLRENRQEKNIVGGKKHGFL